MNKTVNIRTATILLIIFYLTGIAGLAIPATFHLFSRLIPLALLLSAAVLAFFHPLLPDKRSLLIFAVIFLSGFLVEMVGVAAGIIFGDYRYGEGLGFKIAGTPVIIGLNWLFLVYTTSGIMESFRLKTWPVIFGASATMLLYDIILEQVAAPLDMWHWSSGHAPFRNYLAWFLIAFVFQTLVKVSGIKTINRISQVVFACQFLFLLVMWIIFLIRV